MTLIFMKFFNRTLNNETWHVKQKADWPQDWGEPRVLFHFCGGNTLFYLITEIMFPAPAVL